MRAAFNPILGQSCVDSLYTRMSDVTLAFSCPVKPHFTTSMCKSTANYKQQHRKHIQLFVHRPNFATAFWKESNVSNRLCLLWNPDSTHYPSTIQQLTIKLLHVLYLVPIGGTVIACSSILFRPCKEVGESFISLSLPSSPQQSPLFLWLCFL